MQRVIYELVMATLPLFEVYAQYPLPVFTAHEHGRHFWTPVKTGH